VAEGRGPAGARVAPIWKCIKHKYVYVTLFDSSVQYFLVFAATGDVHDKKMRRKP
jgi:hypothetical protein